MVNASMSTVTSWKILTTTEAAWERLLIDCEGAQKSIDIEQYIFGDSGKIIETLVEILKRKASEGIRVRLLLDAVGSFAFYRSKLPAEMELAGVQIVFHRRVIPPSFNRFVPLFLRDHRKLIIIDGEEAHISGVILHERARSWRDTTAILTGDIVDECTVMFEIARTRSRKMSPAGRVLSKKGAGDFYLAGNSFRLRDKHLYRSIVRAITEAKKTIYITTPYFSLPHDLKRALWYARDKGVEVIFLLPKRSDNLLADIISRFYYARLLRHGVTIFHYTRSILHAKTICIDGRWATVGSCNLDWLSIWVNYELNVISKNLEFATELERIFHEDITTSEQVTEKTGGWYGLFGVFN